MQVDPIKPKLKPPGTKRLKLKCDILLSTSAVKFNLRRYTLADVFWDLGDFLDTLNHRVAGGLLVPEVLWPLFGWRQLTHHKKRSLTQDILTTAINKIGLQLLIIGDSGRFWEINGVLDKFVRLCQAKAKAMDKGAETQAARRTSMEPAR